MAKQRQAVINKKKAIAPVDMVPIRGYIQLCAAIVNSGIRQNDEKFLISDWCRFLTDCVIDYNNMEDTPYVKLLAPRRTGASDEWSV